jgi:hypothetical protein
VIEAATRHLALVENATADADPVVRHALLWLLEDKWLSAPGHLVAIKVGNAPHMKPQHCNVCGKELIADDAVVHLEVRDCWRNSATLLDVCRSHLEKHLLEGNVDVLRNQSLKLGLA